MKSNLITFEDSTSVTSEVFKSLRTNIQFSLNENEKNILLTSANAGAGKSFVCANLGVVFAQSGKKVVILDLDLRKRTQDKIFGVPNTTGMSILLNSFNYTKELDLSEIVPKFINNTYVGNLDLITSGPIPHNPSELIMNGNLPKLIEYLNTIYDYVIIDSPPINIVTDALIISKYTDATILVASIDRTRTKFLKEAKDTLLKNKVNLLGVVVNRLPVQKRSYQAKGYGQRYRYMENLPVKNTKKSFHRNEIHKKEISSINDSKFYDEIIRR